MSDALIVRAEKVKRGVEQGKEAFTSIKTEYALNLRLLNETLAEAKEKYSVDSYEELQVAVKDLAVKISDDLEKIETLLAAANISVSSTD